MMTHLVIGRKAGLRTDLTEE